MSELKTEKISESEFRCFDESMDFIVFSGYGKTKEKAEINYHLKMAQIIKPRPIFVENVA